MGFLSRILEFFVHKAKRTRSRLYFLIRRLESRAWSASALIFLLMVFTKLLGFIKLRTIAAFFGASKELDVFWAAFAIPDFVFTLLIAGSVNAALIPVFIKVREKHSDAKVREILNNVINLNILLWLGLWLLLIVGMPVVVAVMYKLASLKLLPFYFRGLLSYDRQYIKLFISLSRIMFFSPFVLGISSILGAYLNTYKRFTPAAAAPLMYNLGIVVSLWIAMRFFPDAGVYTLAFSVIVGSLFHLLVQIPSVLELGVRFRWVLRISRYVKEIVTLAIPRIMGLAVEQIAILFDTFWALMLGAGALSIFRYATSLHLMPVHLFTNSILQAVFPGLNENAARNGKSYEFVRLFYKIFLYILWGTTFIAVLVVVLKIPLVKILLGTGRFTDREVFITSLVLAGFAGAIVMQSLAALIIRAFYALHETKKPFLASVVGVVFNVVFAVIFSNLFSHKPFVHFLKVVWASRLRNFYIPFSLGDLGQFLLTRGQSQFSVVGLAVGISLALVIEVGFALWLLNKEVKLWDVFRGSREIKLKTFGILVFNLLLFWLGFVIYDAIKHVTSSYLVHLVVVSGVLGVLYLGVSVLVEKIGWLGKNSSLTSGGN